MAQGSVLPGPLQLIDDLMGRAATAADAHVEAVAQVASSVQPPSSSLGALPSDCRITLESPGTDDLESLAALREEEDAELAHREAMSFYDEWEVDSDGHMHERSPEPIGLSDDLPRLEDVYNEEELIQMGLRVPPMHVSPCSSDSDIEVLEAVYALERRLAQSRALEGPRGDVHPAVMASGTPRGDVHPAVMYILRKFNEGCF
jgi:hypothetical protein